MPGRLILPTAIVTLLLGACDRAPTPPAQPPAPVSNTTPDENCDPVALLPAPTTEAQPLGEMRITSIDGTYTIDVTLKPDPPRLNELFSMLMIVRKGDEVLTGSAVKVSADASMPQHGHGMTVRPMVGASIIDVEGPATFFTAQGMLLHMPGPWKIYIDITEGAITERASFDIEVH